MGGRYICAMGAADVGGVASSTRNAADGGCGRCLRRKKSMTPPTATSATRPPPTPPAIAPVLDEDEPFVLPVGEEVEVVPVEVSVDLVDVDCPVAVDVVELAFEDGVVVGPEEPVPINTPGEISGASKRSTGEGIY